MLIRVKHVANYALLQCKSCSLEIWLCKILDKYHVCHCLFQCFCSGAAGGWGNTDAKVKQTSAKDWISSSLEPILLNTEKNVLKQTRANVWIAVLLKNPSMFPPFPYNSLEMFFPFPKTKIIPSKCFNCIHSDLSYTSCLLSDRRPIGQQNVVFATTASIGMQDNEHLGKHTVGSEMKLRRS